ncbi:hypothetical protein [Iamia sp. SCSIO 61187]|uniref:hypothetical protein n=1 Tax=Iamia sp. SCSIO 61187 TaxID=2722752 RepID=UPI001C63ACA7|nr:hypothetical protein [Iamia sp. SCSIO 61187]
MPPDRPSPEPSCGRPTAEDAPAERYEVRVRGRLGSRWAAWFDGMTLIDAGDGTTVMRGALVDQAALHGLLEKLRDLGITLLSLTRLGPDAPPERPALPPDQTGPTPPGATP